MHATTIRHRCPHCRAMHETSEEIAGQSFNCLKCEGILTVPTQQALVPVPRPVLVPEIIDDDLGGELEVPDRRHGRVNGDKRMKLRFGKYAELETNADQPTQNAATMGFVGAVLALLGVIVAAMFGIKKRS